MTAENAARNNAIVTAILLGATIGLAVQDYGPDIYLLYEGATNGDQSLVNQALSNMAKKGASDLALMAIGGVVAKVAVKVDKSVIGGIKLASNFVKNRKLANGSFVLAKKTKDVIVDRARGLINDFDNIFGNQIGAIGRVVKNNIKLGKKQIQKKFKHAENFGINANFSKESALEFSNKITKHIESESVNVVKGTYQGDPVTHFLNKETGLNVIVKPNGEFLSGWKLNPKQLKNVLEHGRL